MDDLEAIQLINKDHSDLCMLECLKLWLKQEQDHCPPTWSALVEALRATIVRWPFLADTIEKKYCYKEEDLTEG